MKLAKLFIFLMFLSCNKSDCNLDSATAKHSKIENALKNYKGKDLGSILFYGTEPYWQFVITSDSLKGRVDNQTIRTKLEYDKKSSRGNTFGFSGSNIHGIINEDIWDQCELAVNEEETSWEIYFVFNKKTLKGCGIEKSE